MKKLLLLLSVTITFLISCGEGTGEANDQDTVTDAVRNAEGAENNAYNLPGSDTGAIHHNTTEPGILDKDARDTATQGQ